MSDSEYDGVLEFEISSRGPDSDDEWTGRPVDPATGQAADRAPACWFHTPKLEAYGVTPALGVRFTVPVTFKAWTGSEFEWTVTVSGFRYRDFDNEDTTFLTFMPLAPVDVSTIESVEAFLES